MLDGALWQNLPLYAAFGLFLGTAGWALWRREAMRARPMLTYLLLLVPSFLLVPAGFWAGFRGMPDHELVIHGYRVPFDPESPVISIGSDPEDDLNLYHLVDDEEMIAPSLLELELAPGTNRISLTQIDQQSTNIVSVNGKPLRALPLTTGKTHRIQLGSFDYRDGDADVIAVEIPYLKDLGLVALAAPTFRFRGQVFRTGLAHEIGWVLAPVLPSIATEIGKARHLRWQNRVFHRALDGIDGSVLKQASLIRFEDGYWLAANDAELRLDGQPFPDGMTVSGAFRLQVETRQLGPNRGSYRLIVIPPAETDRHVDFTLVDKRRFALPARSEAARLCLTRDASFYSDTYDITDDRFPAGGVLISREGRRFLFRGEALVPGKAYSAGRAVFSIERAPRGQAWFLAGFSFLFLATALLFPADVLRRVPIIGVLIATGVFLHALRLVLAFRAWQGPPFNENVFFDSLIAPYFYALAVIVLVARYPITDSFRGLLVRLRNFLFPRRRKALPPVPDSAAGRAILSTMGFGLLLTLLFPSWLGREPLFVILFFALVALCLGPIADWERRLDARPADPSARRRYGPIYGLLALLFAAMVAAPLLGGREIIPFLPGRPRPDILIQIGLLVMVAYQAAIWERERRFRVAGLPAIMGVYVFVFLLPLIQGVIARDLGFFIVAVLPLLVILLIASWILDPRLKTLLALSLLAVIALPILFKLQNVALDNVAAQRIAFWIDRPRLRSEHFFAYQAQVPILWSSAQGFFGGGYFGGDWYPSLSGTAVNDNVAAVFIQGELGSLGSVMVMATYGVLALTGILYIRDRRERIGGYRVWVVFGVALIFVWTAAIMFLQNFGVLPLTGKNLPLLGLDSKNDVIRYGLMIGLMARYMRFLED